MACLPGMPCFGPLVRVVYPPTCDPFANRIIDSDHVEYQGDNLSCTGIQNCDTLTVALQKIDSKICSDQFAAQLIQTIANDPVLLAYFCQLVSSCSPTTTTTSTTVEPTTTTTTSSTSTTTTTTTTVTPTTTTTTTVNSCTAPVITEISTNGDYPQSSVTIDYDLNGIVDVLSVTIAYSMDPDFSSGFNDTINNLNLTSYTIPGFSGTTTWYFRLRKVCGTDPEFPTGDSYSNVVSIVPQPTTTTTTATPTTTTTTTTATPTTTTTTTRPLNYYNLMYSSYDSEGDPIDILNTPINQACALLPTIQTGSGGSFYASCVGPLSTVGQAATAGLSCNVIIPTGTYAVRKTPYSAIAKFIAVANGVITDILNCSVITITSIQSAGASTLYINWSSTSTYSTVSVYRSFDGGSTYQFFQSSGPNSPIFIFQTPGTTVYYQLQGLDNLGEVIATSAGVSYTN